MLWLQVIKSHGMDLVVIEAMHGLFNIKLVFRDAQ